MQKKEFAKKMAEKQGVKIVDAERSIDAFIETISDAFKANERVELRGFGNFVRKTRKARKVHDFASGGTMDMPAKEILVFKMSSLYNPIGG